MNVLWFGAAHLKLPPGVHHGCHCRPGSWTTALWDTGHPEMMTLMNLSAPCPVAPIRSILLGNKCVWLTQTKHTPHSHTNTHTFKHTLPEASTVCPTINTNWPFFMVTNIFHMFRDYVETAWPQQKRAAPCSWERKAADCSGQDIY